MSSFITCRKRRTFYLKSNALWRIRTTSDFEMWVVNLVYFLPVFFAPRNSEKSQRSSIYADKSFGIYRNRALIWYQIYINKYCRDAKNGAWSEPKSHVILWDADLVLRPLIRAVVMNAYFLYSTRKIRDAFHKMCSISIMMINKDYKKSSWWIIIRKNTLLA